MANKRILQFAFFTAFIAAILYLPILKGEFVYDDTMQIGVDTYIHTPSNLPEVLSLKVMSRDVIDNNRPFMLLSLMIDSILWGKNAFGYHLTNLVLHSLCSAMVFILIYNCLMSIFGENKNISVGWAAFAASVLFAVHPINSEAVCVITFREDLLAAFFILLGLILALVFPLKKMVSNILYGCAIVLCFFAAVASKENAAVGPMYLLMYWYFIRRQQAGGWIKLISASFAGILLFMILRFTAVPSQTEIFVEKAVYLGGSFSNMLLIQPRIWVYQLCELFWPRLLCADIGGYCIRNISFFAAVAILILIIIFLIWAGRKNKAFLMGILFFILAMLPTSNFVPIFRPVADRYLYLPMFGLCFAVAAMLCQLKTPKGIYKFISISVTAMIYLYFCYFTLEREKVWNNSLSLWQDTVKKNPKSFTGNNNLGFVFYDKGQYQNALSYFQKASEIDRASAEAVAALAITYDALGLKEEAISTAQKAVSMNELYGNYESLMKLLIWTPEQSRKLHNILQSSPKD
ncbi:MAG: tetratricopeptide repeat protein [Phycisphaerales bacterium]